MYKQYVHKQCMRREFNPTKLPPLWTVREIAEKLNISPIWLGQCLRKPGAPIGVPSVSLGHPALRFDPKEVEQWWGQRKPANRRRNHD